MEQVVLVDTEDRELGTMEKMLAHEKGVLHRAFSIFVFNSKGEMLLQQRALHKYHSPGLWTNTCCSHPRPGESLQDAVERRIEEEMGMQCEMKEVFHFVYKAGFDNGLIEHELDHVFTAISDDEPNINPDEVASWKYISTADLEQEIANHPDQFTPWLKIAFPQLMANR